MADTDRKVTLLDEKHFLNLLKVVEAFNAPINEEQAWGICFQCTKHFKAAWIKSHEKAADDIDVFRLNGLESVCVHKDGSITSCNCTDKVESQSKLLESLGVVVYQALDYGLEASEEHSLSPPLEELILKMTAGESTKHGDDFDEGIENDHDSSLELTFDEVLTICRDHLPATVDASTHYKAVCRALANEADELATFLEKITYKEGKVKLDEDKEDLDDLNRPDWARLWIQVLKQLRTCIQLKKTQQKCYTQSIEYELTPYEILMEDIRSRRYSLNKVSDANKNRLPAKVKEFAHNKILEFIRSRPPLHPAQKRVLKSPPPKEVTPRDQLLEDIRDGDNRHLKPTSYGLDQRRHTIATVSGVETSRTKLFDDGLSPNPTRKLIKADLSLLSSYSDDDYSPDEDDMDIEFKSTKIRVSPGVVEQLSPITPTNEKPTWQKRVALDIVTSERRTCAPERRHSITVCESPSQPFKVLGPLQLRFEKEAKTNSDASATPVIDPHGIPWTYKSSPPNQVLSPNNRFNDPLECLSLTVEEVMHIRNVLTKAELEGLLVDHELYKLVSKCKICFSCKVTRFTLFGEWGTKCKFCKRTVCNRCAKKMHVPTEHFENIPVYTLSPSPLTPQTEAAILATDVSGSCPSSPVILQKLRNLTPLTTSTPTERIVQDRHGHLQRAQTICAKSDNLHSPPGDLKGPQMTICKDCKAMIVGIIRASRTSLLKSGPSSRIRQNIDGRPNPKPNRNFHLNLKPVYK